MLKRFKNLKIIGCSLSALYGISFIAYGRSIPVGPLVVHAIVVTAIFATLFLSSLTVAAAKNLGRQAAIVLHCLALIYFSYLSIRFPGFMHPAYVLMALIALLFLSQEKIRLQIVADWRKGRKSILVVDDDEGLQTTIKRILLPKGYSVLAAITGERGMQIARVQKPDLIILDVILPGIKGREVCAILTEDEETREIPIVFLTAKDSPDDIDAEMAAGATSHLAKPVDAKALLSEIKRIIG